MFTTHGARIHTSALAERERLWQRHRVASAAIASVIGILATSVGAGLGIRHMQKTGVSVVSVSGLTLLVVGLALLGYVAVIAWRGIRGWRRLAILPVGALGLVVMWSVAIAVMFTYVPRTALGSATPADGGLHYTDVTLQSTDGIRLSAWVIPSTNRAAVVLLHGAGENRTATLPQAVVLARHGYGVLMLDARGQGRSGGRGMDAGWYGDADVGGAVAFLQHRPDVDPARIAVLGLSMGAEEAIGAAGSNRAIRAVIAEGATQRTAADKAGWLPGGFSGTVQRGLDQLTYAVTGLLSSAPTPITLHRAIAKATETPFLLIAAGRVKDETRSATHLQSAAPDRVQVWTAPGASHTHALSADPQEWEARVTAFLTASLGS